MSATAEQSGSTTAAASGFSPVAASERIDAIDAIRGFALFGILLVNIGFFAHPVSEPFYLPANAGTVDRAVHWLTVVFAQGKFYPLFSFLFGLGFAIQLERARSRNTDVTQLYVRRMLGLMVIGLLHGIFIWAGDILTAYSVIGFMLLFLGRASPRALLVLAGSAYAVQLLLIGAFTVWLSGVHADPEAAEALLLEMTAGLNEAAALRTDAWAAYAGGSYAEITQVRVREFSMALQNMVFFGMQVLGMFLLGAWFGRRGILARPHAHRRLLRLLLAGLVVALPLSAWFAQIHADIDYLGKPTPEMGKAYLLNLVAGPLMALGYMAAIALAMQTRAARLLRVLAPVGRMALSNYLLQSIICTMIFYSYGLGLFGVLTATQLLGVVLLVFVAQVIFSNVWMRCFRFGPFEWSWRSATYLRLQPMKVERKVDGSRSAHGPQMTDR